MKSALSILATAAVIVACNPKTEKLCYVHESKDTVQMTMTIDGKNVSGELNYSLFEKDRNRGNFKGTISGDMITAEYQFQSEGMESTREISFTRKGKNLIDNSSGIELHEIMCGEEK